MSEEIRVQLYWPLQRQAFLSPPVCMHVGPICIAFCMPVCHLNKIQTGQNYLVMVLALHFMLGGNNIL